MPTVSCRVLLLLCGSVSGSAAVRECFCCCVGVFLDLLLCGSASVSVSVAATSDLNFPSAYRHAGLWCRPPAVLQPTQDFGANHLPSQSTNRHRTSVSEQFEPSECLRGVSFMATRRVQPGRRAKQRLGSSKPVCCIFVFHCVSYSYRAE